MRGLGTASTTFGRSGFRADLNVTRADGWRDADAVRAAERHAALGLRARASAAGSRRWRPFSHIDQPGDGGGDITAEDFESRLDPHLLADRVPAGDGGTALDRAPGAGETSSFGATLYARYNELDLLPSWQLSFDPQIWESRHRSLGLLTRYRRA